MSPAVLCLVIFFACMAMFILNRIPSWVVAITSLILMVVCNVCSFEVAFKNYSSQTIVLVVGMMIVGKATFDTGLAQDFGRTVLKLAGNDERKTVIFGMLATGVMSAFLSNIASLSIMVYMMTGIAKADSRVRFKNLIMPTAIAAELGGMATLVGSTPQLTASQILKSTMSMEPEFSFFDFSIPGFLILIAASLYAGYVAYPIGKKLWGNDGSSDVFGNSVGKTEMEELPCADRKTFMVVIFLLTIVMYIFARKIKAYIPGFNNSTVAVVSACLCLLSGCIKPSNAIYAVSWPLIIWLGACLGMADAINKSGAGELIANFLIGFLPANITPFGIFAFFIIITVILTQVISNSTVVTLVLPVALSLVPQLGYNGFPFALGIAMASQIAIGTPIANGTIAMAMVADYKFGDFFKYSFGMIIISTAILIALVPVLYPLC